MSHNADLGDLQGISYVIYKHPETGEQRAAFWEDRPSLGRTHASVIQKLTQQRYATCLSNGVLGYCAETNVWVPLFECALVDERSEADRRKHLDIAAQTIAAHYQSNTAVKAHLDARLTNTLEQMRVQLVRQGLDPKVVADKIRDIKTNIYH